MHQDEVPTQVRFVKLPVAVLDEETWSFTHDPTPEPAEGEVRSRRRQVRWAAWRSRSRRSRDTHESCSAGASPSYLHRVPEALEALSKWMDEGRLATREHILEGIDQFPAAVRMIFAGENRGKLLIRLPAAHRA